MSLSEVPGRELRMSDLAGATDLSASRMTRVVDELQSRGLVTKRASAEDGRGHVASLTPAGLAKLKTASGPRLQCESSGIRPCRPGDNKRRGPALAEIAARLEDRL